MYDAEYHPNIRKDLKKIDPPIREAIRSEHIPVIIKSRSRKKSRRGSLWNIFISFQDR